MIALNHSFVAGLVRGPTDEARAALVLIQHCIKRTRMQPIVHETLATFDTGRGALVQWANTQRRDPEFRPLVELLLRMLSGPFVPSGSFGGPITPPIDTLDEWLQDTVRRLLDVAASPAAICGMISPSPTGGADATSYASSEAMISNWLDSSAFDHELVSRGSERTTLEVLLQAEQEMDGRLVVLPQARRSAEGWSLDCAASELHRALLALEEFAVALGEGLSREAAANRYHMRSTIPMSQESAATWRMPTRRRQRLFVAGPHGEKYFDMHAKPGNLTRVHIWVATQQDAETTIYVGHCGRHLE
jgi:hypothetical protein